MKKFVSQIFIVLLSAGIISAQSDFDKAKLVDEFSNISIGELLSRLDILGSELLRDEKAIALVKIYGGTKERKHFVFPSYSEHENQRRQKNDF